MASKLPIQRLPLRQQIYAILRERIIQGDYAPGSSAKDQELA